MSSRLADLCIGSWPTFPRRLRTARNCNRQCFSCSSQLANMKLGRAAHGRIPSAVHQTFSFTFAMVSQSDLTKPVVIATKVPAPPKENGVKYSDDGSDPFPTIELRACSEFTEYAAPVDYFSSKSKLKTVRSFRGEPVIFAIGKGDRLNCLVHEAGGSQGWSLHDVSPSTAKVISFDVSVFAVDDPKTNQKAGVFFAAATQVGEDLTQVHTAFVPASAFASSSGSAGLSQWSKIPWRDVADPKGGKSVTSILIGSVKGRKVGQSTTVVFAGTKLQRLKAATYYAIDPTENVTDPWVPFSPDSEADQILDVQPASLQGEDGLFVFSEKSDRTECLIYSLAPETLDKTNSKNTLPGNLGKINAICSSKNPWNFTDLIFASEKGIGFINFKHPTDVPQEVTGLPKIGFREVVCNEKINPNNQEETCITMFAVADNDDLYYIQGSRKWKKDGSITLASSGLPIRQNVSRVSCQFNAAMNSSELIYTGTGANDVKHLLRDPETTCWSESTISFAAPRSLTKYQAYVTTVSLRSTDGRSVGKDFAVKIKSESMVVLINDRSYGLSTKTREVRTDGQGQLIVVSQASESLKTPAYAIEISREGITHTAVIDGGQRVVEGLSKMNSPEKLANAKSTNGEAIFEKGALQNRQDDFEQSAGLLKEFPSMLSGLSSQSADKSGTEVTLERENSAVSSLATMKMSAIEVSESSVTDFLGDALEWIRGEVKNVFKVAFKVVMKGVKLILTIAGKVISFVVDTVGPLVHAVGTFLKDKLGLDFGKLFKMLGLIFNPEKTKQNQKLLETTIKTVLTLPGQLVRANSQNLDDLFDLMEMGLKPYLGNNTKIQSSEDPNTRLKKSPLGWLFDNPVIKIIMKLNPLSIILEAFAEEFDASGLGDDFEVPNFVEFLTPLATTLWNGFQTVVVDLLDFIKDLWSKVSDAASDPSKSMEKIREVFQAGFWFLFNTVKTLVKTAWQAVGDFMDGLVKFLEAKWKFPFITSLFEWYAEQPFTLMNVCTFVLARVLGIVIGDDNVAKYIDPGNTMDELSAVAKRSDIFSIDLKSVMSMQIPTESVVVANTPARSAGISSQSMSAGTQRLGQSNMSLSANRSPMLKMGVNNSTQAHRSFSTSTKPAANTAQHSLSKDAKARIHKYEKCSRLTTSIVGIFKFATISMETAHVFAEVGAAAPVDHDGPQMALPIMTIITTSVAFAGSIVHLCNWIVARNYSEEVKLHLDDSFASICTGVAVGMGSNAIAIGFSIASYYAKKKGTTAAAGKGFAAVSGLFLCIGSYGETVGIHLVPSFSSDEPDLIGKTLGFVEAIGTTGALGALLAAHAKDPDFTTLGLVVDGLSTLVITLTGLTLLVSDDGGH
ncbi:uncharacterized protein LY89DRAFT_717075 [Mollisia scopiformis]|uniref:Uncharacterized protein n=1 Tax=Mollisia scopiformis TaxID=149040 RepID=A0A194XHJ5_MOLSC|nr:uncharacterized protein LY89DRAFT_717075 [Mollisia scopiformis]KUJ19606.1 hypothetical protein LY89DRAFT_717075 [Mollisia scopiformis]